MINPLVSLGATNSVASPPSGLLQNVEIGKLFASFINCFLYICVSVF